MIALSTTFLIFIFILQQTPTQSVSSPSCTPQQIHLSLSDGYTSDSSSSSLRVIFHTKEECKTAYIILADSQNRRQKITATSVELFEESFRGGSYSTYIHTFDFPKLSAYQIYRYWCYATGDFLPEYQGPFLFYPPSPNYVQGIDTKVVMFGDLDASTEGMTTVNALTDLARTNFTQISAYIHLGDIAYNLSSQSGKRGDSYMNTVQPFAASIPYMVTAGNHEDFNNFSNFNARFKMPLYEKSQNHYHSYNIGNMHFVSFNLELILHDSQLKKYMLDWLEKDLAEAVLNRDKQPWIIAYSHRPIYCSHKDKDCRKNPSRFKDFEDVLLKYNVDLLVGGHVHFYERMLPIKYGAVTPFQVLPNDENYNHIVNPESPVYLLQGMAGHRGDKANPKRIYKGKAFTVKVDKAYSYAALQSSNSTHLLVENFRSDNGSLNDYFYIIKSNNREYQALAFDFMDLGDESSQARVSVFIGIFLCISIFFL